LPTHKTYGAGRSRQDMTELSIDDLRAEARRLEQQGFYEQALGVYSKVLALRPNDAETAFYFKALQRNLKPPGAYSDIKVIWQAGPDGMWEKEWVRHLLSGLPVDELVDGQRQTGRDCAIIVDSNIGDDKMEYYAHLFNIGFRFGIVHLSDELYADDCRCYHYANFVIRDYWSSDHAQNRRVLAVPLGLNNGYAPDRRTTAERRFVWSFLGAINKSSRVRMMEVMAQVPNGFAHAVEGVPSPFNARPYQHDGKSLFAIAEYARVMSQTLFAPCPAGWRNLDSFRVYEALEAGCIPIVERRPALDYFARLLGPHPMPSIVDWVEAPALIAGLMAAPERLDALRCSCEIWWQEIRNALPARVAAHARDYLDLTEGEPANVASRQPADMTIR
jgi:hypothetical protein